MSKFKPGDSNAGPTGTNMTPPFRIHIETAAELRRQRDEAVAWVRRLSRTENNYCPECFLPVCSPDCRLAAALAAYKPGSRDREEGTLSATPLFRPRTDA